MKKHKFMALILLLVMSISLFSGCATKLPVPQVKEGRFDFSITYEVEGEVKTYTGVYVCEYEGVHKFLGGYSRAWSGYIENSDDSLKFPFKRMTRVSFTLVLDCLPRILWLSPILNCWNLKSLPRASILCITAMTPTQR